MPHVTRTRALSPTRMARVTFVGCLIGLGSNVGSMSPHLRLGRRSATLAIVAALVAGVLTGCAFRVAIGGGGAPATPEQARRMLEQLILPPGDDPPVWVRRALSLAAQAGGGPRMDAIVGWWGSADHPAAARPLFDKALTAAPDDPVVLRYAGEGWLRRIALQPDDEQKVRARKAAKLFRRALLADPDAAAAGLGLARALALFDPDHLDIRPTLERAHRARPDDRTIALALARRCLLDGDTRRAAAILDALGDAPLPRVLQADVPHLRRQVYVATAARPVEQCPAGTSRLQVVAVPQRSVARDCLDASRTVPASLEPAHPSSGLCRRKDITAVVEDLRPMLQACYEELLLREPGEGMLVTGFVIGHGGRPSDVRVDSSGDLAPIADCLADVIRGAGWIPPAGAGLCKVTYPFVFNQE